MYSILQKMQKPVQDPFLVTTLSQQSAMWCMGVKGDYCMWIIEMYKSDLDL